MIKLFDMGFKRKVRTGNKLSTAFDNDYWGETSDGISPMLFNIAVEDTLRNVREAPRGANAGGKINNLPFTDDIAITAEKKQDLPRLTEISVKEASK